MVKEPSAMFENSRRKQAVIEVVKVNNARRLHVALAMYPLTYCRASSNYVSLREVQVYLDIPDRSGERNVSSL